MDKVLIPVPIWVDRDVADLVLVLNQFMGVRTLSSHGGDEPTVEFTKDVGLYDFVYYLTPLQKIGVKFKWTHYFNVCLSVDQYHYCKVVNILREISRDYNHSRFRKRDDV